MPRASSVKDVAARAGVSLGTVSNVLNRPDRVSPATRSRVEHAMRELGFVRNESARQLRAGHSRTLAYVLLDARNPFFTDVAEGAERAAEAAGLSLFLCHSDNRASREGDYLAHLVEQRVQGILVTPVDPHAAVLDDVRRNGTPLVIVDRTRDDGAFCSVAVDDELGGRLAVEHLARARPHAGRLHRRARHDRPGARPPRGARRAWADAGLPADQLTVIPTDALTVVEGRSAGERLMGIGRRRRPTAAFCANDLLALGLLQQLSTSGATVPGDLAIVGYDDIEFASAAAVPLTSVRQPRQELGRRAAELVLDEADNPEHVHQQLVFTPELVARRSTLG